MRRTWYAVLVVVIGVIVSCASVYAAGMMIVSNHISWSEGTYPYYKVSWSASTRPGYAGEWGQTEVANWVYADGVLFLNDYDYSEDASGASVSGYKWDQRREQILFEQGAWHHIVCQRGEAECFTADECTGP